ncbi:AmmeMemoRadiSam system protein B [Candidatus Marsarchaeota archaeon]|nr:AmmeMemoRadiSam system protein B [Candidatus Marsarchaeota archaeon]
MIRTPAVAGQFYPSSESRLGGIIDEFMSLASVEGEVAKKAVSYVAPHAGYRYSGQTAAFTYKALSLMDNLVDIDTFVIVGPNHTGLGYPVSVSGMNWETPLGKVENDLDLAFAISEESDHITIDDEAHRLEHSIEVQLPFLQKVVKTPKCCFVCMGDQSVKSAEILGRSIGGAAKRLNRNITVIASSDFNHYESAVTAKSKDMPAIKELIKLNYKEFDGKIRKLGDSACGHGPVAVSAIFGKECGAKEGHLLRYSNSGDITGDYASVVAYSSIIFA